MFALSGLCLSFVFSLLHFLLDSQQIPWFPDQISRLPPWNKHSDILTGPHQLVWLISFGSHHCLLYHLFVSFVSFYVLVYGFLLFQLSLSIGKVLDQIPLKYQTLSCTQPCTHPSILWKGRSSAFPRLADAADPLAYFSPLSFWEKLFFSLYYWWP